MYANRFFILSYLFIYFFFLERMRNSFAKMYFRSFSHTFDIYRHRSLKSIVVVSQLGFNAANRIVY